MDFIPKIRVLLNLFKIIQVVIGQSIVNGSQYVVDSDSVVIWSFVFDYYR